MRLGPGIRQMNGNLCLALLTADTQPILLGKGVLYALVDVAHSNAQPLRLHLAAFQFVKNVFVCTRAVVLHDNIHTIRRCSTADTNDADVQHFFGSMVNGVFHQRLDGHGRNPAG